MAGDRQWRMATGPVPRAFEAHQEPSTGGNGALGASGVPYFANTVYKYSY